MYVHVQMKKSWHFYTLNMFFFGTVCFVSWLGGHQAIIRIIQLSTKEWIYLIPKDKAVYAIPRVFARDQSAMKIPGPPEIPKKNTRGDLIFRLYIRNCWITYILWSDLTASLSKMMCWKRIVFVFRFWDFGPLSQGWTVKHFDFGWVFVDAPGGVIFVSMVNFYLQTPFWWLMVWLITHIYKNLNKSSPWYRP